MWRFGKQTNMENLYVFAGEMYYTICSERADDLGLT